MLIISNAIKSITRSKGRNILVGIVVLTIAVSSSIALAIKSAAEAAKKSGLALQTITGTISIDRLSLMENAQAGFGGRNMDDMRDMMREYSGLTLSEMQTYAVSDYVKDFYYTASTSLNAAGGIEPYSTQDISGGSFTGPNGMPSFGMGGRNGGFGGMAMGDFSVTGYSGESAMTRFLSGESKITDGSMFDITEADYSCLISYELALFNNLAVGSAFSLSNPDNQEELYSFSVVGIYTNASSDVQSGQMIFGTANDPSNLICVSYNTLHDLEERSSQEDMSALFLQTAGTYVFADKTDYDSFEEELKDRGLPEHYALSSPDIHSYEQSLVPLDNLSSFATTLLVIILAVGAVILVVLNIFNIRERKYEVGVLTAIGIRKTKVAAQFVVELLAVTLLAIVIGTGVGAVASVPVSNSSLETQITSQESSFNMREQNFGRPGAGNRMPGVIAGFGFGNMPDSVGSVDYVDTIDAGVNLSILLELIGIGVVLTVVSSLGGIVFVLRYDPLRILAERT